MARQSQGRLGAVRNFGDVKTAEGNLTRRKANITAPPYGVKWETAVHDSALRNLSQRKMGWLAVFIALGFEVDVFVWIYVGKRTPWARGAFLCVNGVWFGEALRLIVGFSSHGIISALFAKNYRRHSEASLIFFRYTAGDTASKCLNSAEKYV